MQWCRSRVTIRCRPLHTIKREALVGYSLHRVLGSELKQVPDKGDLSFEYYRVNHALGRVGGLNRVCMHMAAACESLAADGLSVSSLED